MGVRTAHSWFTAGCTQGQPAAAAPPLQHGAAPPARLHAPAAGEMVQMMVMRELPLSEGCRMRVSLESR
jgi:hypothetical protein